jgi:hypothetical protein
VNLMLMILSHYGKGPEKNPKTININIILCNFLFFNIIVITKINVCNIIYNCYWRTY